jgi:NADPH:quinone reductase-like Zn-dependent oxidoreductase
MATTVVAPSYGGPEVLVVIEEEVGPPGPGEVLVDVRAVGTNPIDVKLFSGRMGRVPGQLPLHLGSEASGVVVEAAQGSIGPAGPITIGDEVMVFRAPGAYTSRLIAPASSVIPKPPTLTFEEASGLLLTGSTAVHALKVTAVGPGDTIVFHGASGGVGLMAVQLAVLAGARVIGTASESHHEALRQLGAEPVAYGPGLLERLEALAPDGLDAAIDGIGTDEAVDVSLALVPDRERIATIVATPRSFELGLKVLGGAPGADPGTDIRAAARLELAALAATGQLVVLVAATYPLTEATAALELLAQGHTHGKIILVP